MKKSAALPKTTQSAKSPRFDEIHLQEGEIVEITKDMIIGDVVAAYPQTLPIFEELGIHCVGCYASTFESIAEGVIRHGIDPDKVCEMLNKKIRNSTSDSK